MKILNYDVEDDISSNYRQLYKFMPDRCFRMLICGPSGSGKSDLLLDLIYRLLYYDKIHLYTKNPHQSKYKHLFDTFDSISKDVGYPVIEASNDKILPLDKISEGSQRLIVIDDYLNTGANNDREIRNYFTNSRNKQCSCIYLSQSFYQTDKTIRLNCTHYCIFEFPSSREQNMICRELGINKNDYIKATSEPYSFIYIDKSRKKMAKISTKKYNLHIYK